jgi:hypothetical protein
MIISSTSAAYRWSNCEITWKNLVVSLLMPAKENCASAWVNHTAGRSAQNSGSRTATLDTSAGGELSAASMLRRGHQCGDVNCLGHPRTITNVLCYYYTDSRRELLVL